MWYFRSLERDSVIQKLALERKKWSGIVQYLCNSTWDLKYIFFCIFISTILFVTFEFIGLS